MWSQSIVHVFLGQLVSVFIRYILVCQWFRINYLQRLIQIPFSNSIIIHQVKTKEIMTVTVFGYLILINIIFYDFNSPFSP